MALKLDYKGSVCSNHFYPFFNSIAVFGLVQHTWQTQRKTGIALPNKHVPSPLWDGNYCTLLFSQKSTLSLIFILNLIISLPSPPCLTSHLTSYQSCKMLSEILGTKLKKTIYLDQFFPHNSSLFLYFHLTAEAKENFTISNYATLVFSELQKLRFFWLFFSCPLSIISSCFY